MKRRIEFIGSSMLAVCLLAAGVLGMGIASVHALSPAGPLTVTTPGSSDPGQSGSGSDGFGLALPAGSTCPGDGAAGYRIQSFMVPEAVDPSTLTYGPDGPIPSDTGANYRQPLYTPAFVGFISEFPGPASTPGGPGDIPTLGTFSFVAWAPDGLAFIPATVYDIGIACSLEGQTTKFWVTQLRIVADPDDSTGIGWEAVDAPEETTTTTTTVDGGSTTTTTTVAGGSTTTTTTTVAGGSTTSTTVVGDTDLGNVAPGGSVAITGAGFEEGESVEIWLHSEPLLLSTVTADASGEVSTTVTIPANTVVGAHELEMVGQTSGQSVSLTLTVTMAATSTTTTFYSPGSGTGGTGGTPGASGYPTSTGSGELASTGSSSWSLVVWAALLLVLGRMVLLIGRAPRVVPVDRR